VQPVLLALLAQLDHKVQPVQRERQDLPEVEVEHLDRKEQQGLLVQLVRQELRAQQELREQQALQEQLVPQEQQVQRAQQVLLAYQMLQ
jgi:hypothetical protein